MNQRIKLALMLAIIFFVFNSCATIFLGTKQNVSIDSNPRGADVYVNGNNINKQTPCKIKITKKNPDTEYNNKNEVVYILKKPDYYDSEYRDKSKVHWLIALDYYLGIVPGLVDNATKGHRIYKEDVFVDLQPLEKIDDTGPLISIIQPHVNRGFKLVEQNSQITIQGNIIDESGVFEVYINKEKVQLANNGDFLKTVILNLGDNSFIITATDTKKNTTVETFIIQRQENLAQRQDNFNNNNSVIKNNEQINVSGKYYALIIGNNIYQDQTITSLDEPISDATSLYEVLTTQYLFEPENVKFLKNANYIEMIEAFDDLNNLITPNDNLLVFYAGHGWWDENRKLGYWLPCDAKKGNTAFWIPNSRISDYMGSIKSKHTLLIADACFSGSIFKTRSAFADAQPAINKLYDLPSKKAMTSGNLKEVPDKSVFLHYLVQRLIDNKEKYISSDVLFASFRQAVLNNSPTEPQYGTIQNAGDEGGEFIFIRR